MSLTKDENMSEERVSEELPGDENVSQTNESGNPDLIEEGDSKESSPESNKPALSDGDSDDEGQEEEDDTDEEEDSDTEKDKTDDTTKNKIKAKPKKPVLVNVFAQCTSSDLLDSSVSLRNLMEDNDVNVKDIKLSTEPIWIRLGQLELEKTDDREKALVLSGKLLNGKEIMVERVRDNANDRLYAPTEEQLRSLYPKAKEIRLPKKNGKNRGFAFINFATKKEVVELIRDRQSEELDGKTLKLGTYTSKEKLESRKQHSKANSTKKSLVTRPAISGGKPGGGMKSGGGRPNYAGYYSRQYGGGRYPNQIRSLLDIDTSGFGNVGRYQGDQFHPLFDEYGFYNGDFGLDNYLYDLHSRMGLESGLAKRMGIGRGYAGHYGMDRRFVGMNDAGMGYGRGVGGSDRRQLGIDSRTGGFTGYGNPGAYIDGSVNSYRNTDRKRNRSGGSRIPKGKSGWPAK
ncbi:nucleolin-like isoform X2 [Liolophura sinensis]|uniref:nucleolin-like isoform X2 n=1 Tax=Liolophura sinensis TaxID=3198878 RepID=UPI0031582A39